MQDNFELSNPNSKNYIQTSFWEVLLIIVLFFVFLTISSIFPVLFLFLDMEDAMMICMPIIWVFPFICTFVLYYFLFMKNKNESYNFKINFSTPFYLYPIFLIAFIGLFFINEYITNLIPTDVPVLKQWYKMLEETYKMLDKYPFIMVFVIAFMAPIFEELLFRGIILRGLLNNGTNPTLAIIFTAVLFGVVHLNPWQFIGATLLGSFMGWVFYKTKSLLNTILLHFFNNATGCFFYFQYGNVNISDISSYTKESFLVMGILIFAIFSFIFHHFTKNNKWISY